MLRTKLQERFIQTVSAPGDRSKQRLVGPSEIGGCPFCLGVRIAEKFPEVYPDLPPRDVRENYPAWLGTALHYYLEKHIPFGEHELKVPIADVPNYGLVSGHVDHYFEGEVTDFKNLGTNGAKKLASLWSKNKDVIPDVGYRVQQQLYGFGLAQTGREVTHVQLMVLPKTGYSFDSITFYREEYDQSVAERALDRLNLIVETVRAGNMEEIPYSEDCYNCS